MPKEEKWAEHKEKNNNIQPNESQKQTTSQFSHNTVV